MCTYVILARVQLEFNGFYPIEVFTLGSLYLHMHIISTKKNIKKFAGRGLIIVYKEI